MGSKLYTVFLHSSLVAMIAISMSLVWQIRFLRAQLAPGEMDQIEAGEMVDAIDVTHLSGESAVLSWHDAQRDRLLLIFTTTCPACKENQPTWQEIHGELGEHLDIVGVSLDPLEATRAYEQAYALPYDVVTVADRQRFVTDLNIPAIPFTLHVASNGSVLGAWRGILTPEQQRQLTATARSVASSI